MILFEYSDTIKGLNDYISEKGLTKGDIINIEWMAKLDVYILYYWG